MANAHAPAAPAHALSWEPRHPPDDSERLPIRPRPLPWDADWRRGSLSLGLRASSQSSGSSEQDSVQPPPLQQQLALPQGARWSPQCRAPSCSNAWLAHLHALPTAWLPGITGAAQAQQALWDALVLAPWVMQHAGKWPGTRLQPPRSLLLHGPPGCGKTTLVHAAAQAVQARLLVLPASTVLSKFVGESERVLAQAFTELQAPTAQPAILMLDELDTLFAARGSSAAHAAGHDRLLGQLLMEMNSFASSGLGLLVACTNRRGALDAALDRRFARVVEVPAPSRADLAQHLASSVQQAGAQCSLPPDAGTRLATAGCANFAALDHAVQAVVWAAWRSLARADSMQCSVPAIPPPAEVPIEFSEVVRQLAALARAA